MILYHGSNTEISKIDLEMCKPYKDFGKAFYLKKLVRIVFRCYRGGGAVGIPYGKLRQIRGQGGIDLVGVIAAYGKIRRGEE